MLPPILGETTATVKWERPQWFTTCAYITTLHVVKYVYTYVWGILPPVRRR